MSDSFSRIKTNDIPLTMDSSCLEILNCLSRPIVIFDKNLIVLFANQAIGGFDTSSLIGRPVTDIVMEDQRALFIECIERVVAGNVPQSCELRLCAVGGKATFSDCQISTLPKKLGREGGCIASFMDISAHKQMENDLIESKERYKSVVEDQTEVISRFRADGTFLFVNDVYCRVFGRTKTALIGNKWFPVAHPEDLEMINAGLVRMTKENPVVVIENRVYVAGGALRWMQFVNRGFYDEKGSLTEIQSVGRDITDQKMAENKFTNLFEMIRDAACVVSMEGRFVECNGHFSNMLGYSKNEFWNLNYRDITPAKWHALDEAVVREQVLPRGFSDVYEKEYIHKNGRIFPVELRVSLIRDAQGRDSFMWAIVRDVSERKEMERRLKESEELFSTVFRFCPVGMGLSRMSDERFVTVNDVFLEIFGYGRDEVIGRTSRELGLWTVLSEREKVVNELKQGGRVRHVEAKFTHKSGEVGDLLISVEKVTLSGQDYMLGALTDITRRKQIERALLDSEAKLTTVFNLFPIGISIVDLNRRVIDCNPALEKILGLSRKAILEGGNVGRKFLDSNGEPMNPESFPSSLAIGEQREVRDVEIEIRREDGSVIMVSVSAAPLPGQRAIIATVDITSHKNIETGLRNTAERLELAQRVSRMGVWDWNIATGHTEWTSEMFELFGVDPAKRTASLETWKRVLHSEFTQIAIDRLNRAVNERGVLDSEYLINRENDGQPRWIHAIGKAMYDLDNKPVRMLGICVDVTERKEAEVKLKEYAAKLEEQKVALEQKNTALREVLEQVHVEKNKVMEHVNKNVKEIILPQLKKMRLKGASAKYFDLVQAHLKELTSAFGEKLAASDYNLTPREMEICAMIKGGLTSKEIAGLLGISCQTVEKHRKNIRRKMRLDRRHSNLKVRLQDFVAS